jgi:hypothetical protein
LFSFENSVCDDYVTEKLFKILPFDVVPIVYGGAGQNLKKNFFSATDAPEK